VLIVWRFWEPSPPGTLRTSPGLYRDGFIFALSGYAATVKCNPLNGVRKIHLGLSCNIQCIYKKNTRVNKSKSYTKDNHGIDEVHGE